MFSYLFMKILEARPHTYDRRMNQLSGGRVAAIKERVAAAVPAGAHVLEIGCGTGQLAEMLCKRGAQVEGFDPNAAMVEVARQRIESGGLAGRLAVREMGVEGMDELPAAEYDAVVATLVLSELNDDERRWALKHAARALKPSGVLIVADEVRPRTAGKRALYTAARSAALVATYLVSRSSTRPLLDLPAELAERGLRLESEERSHGDAFAIFVARRPPADGEAPGTPSTEEAPSGEES